MHPIPPDANSCLKRGSSSTTDDPEFSHDIELKRHCANHSSGEGAVKPGGQQENVIGKNIMPTITKIMHTINFS
jgi:hypothetical protein